jgi:maltoporin
MIQYGTGAASNFSNAGNGTTIPNPTPYINYSRQFLFTEQIVLQPNDKFDVMPIFIYQRTKDGNPQQDWAQRVSFGVRPEVFLTRHLSLTGDCGFDRTHLSGSYEGWLLQMHFCASNRAGQKILRPAGTSRLRDICQLVERLPWVGGRCAV